MRVFSVFGLEVPSPGRTAPRRAQEGPSLEASRAGLRSAKRTAELGGTIGLLIGLPLSFTAQAEQRETGVVETHEGETE